MESLNFIRYSINKSRFCEGDYAYYFALLLTRADHLQNDYHNLTHTLYVTWNCVKACEYYVSRELMTPRQGRNLVIAAIFHDWNHTGHKAKDSEQIARAIEALRKHILPEDRPYLDEICQIIWATEYPPKPIAFMSLSQKIIREADTSQALSPTWMQQVLGLASENGIDRIELLNRQKAFLESLVFETAWGRDELMPLLPDRIIDVEILRDDILSPEILALIQKTEEAYQ